MSAQQLVLSLTFAAFSRCRFLVFSAFRSLTKPFGCDRSCGFVTGLKLYELMDDYDSLRTSIRKSIEREIVQDHAIKNPDCHHRHDEPQPPVRMPDSP